MKLLILIFLFLSLGNLNAQVTFIKRPLDLNFQGACSVCTSDINGDGRKDILGAASGSNELTWWENDGSVPPQFTKHLIDNSFQGAIYISAGDVTGDSLPDVLAAAWFGNEIALWINNGGNPVTWTKQVIETGFLQAHEIKTTDIDGSGGADIVAVSAGLNEVAWWRNNGGNPVSWARFTVSASVLGARSVFPVDIEDDGDTDLLCAAFTSNEILLFRNEGGNPIQWTKEVIGNNFNGAHWVHACDMDNDNDPDILGAAYLSGDIAIWYNEGGNPLQWSKYTVESNLAGALSVIADDLDGNGFWDIVAAGDQSGDVIIWYNEGTGSSVFTKYVLESNFPGAWPVHASDLDNDSDCEILSSSSSMNDIYWWENQLITMGKNEPSGQNKLPARIISMPNPFRDFTLIRITLPEESMIYLQVVSLSGKIVRKLHCEKTSEGVHYITWDGKNDSGSSLDNGTYFAVLRIPGKPEITARITRW